MLGSMGGRVCVSVMAVDGAGVWITADEGWLSYGEAKRLSDAKVPEELLSCGDRAAGMWPLCVVGEKGEKEAVSANCTGEG